MGCVLGLTSLLSPYRRHGNVYSQQQAIQGREGGGWGGESALEIRMYRLCCDATITITTHEVPLCIFHFSINIYKNIYCSYFLVESAIGGRGCTVVACVRGGSWGFLQNPQRPAPSPIYSEKKKHFIPQGKN